METVGLDSPRRLETLKTLLLIAVIAVYAVTLLPMFAIAKYNVPFGDDTLFGDSVAAAFRETGSLFAACRAACGVVARYYESWQGTYAGIFLMALHPGVFGVRYYALAPFLLIGALTLATLLFTRTAGKRLLRLDAKTRLILAFTILLFSVQFPPSAREAFYWYNGAVYYTFFHCLLLVLASLLILMRFAKRKRAAVACGVGVVLLSAVIAGGNYATALPCGIVLGLDLLCWAIPALRARDAAHPRIGATIAALALAVFLAGMFVSVSAPGNAVRQAAVNEAYTGLSAPVAVLVSFPLAFTAVLNRFDIGSVLLVGLLLLFVTPAIKQSRYAFRYPALAVLLAFGIFAAQFTPTLYAAGSPGPYRLRNLVFLTTTGCCAFAPCISPAPPSAAARPLRPPPAVCSAHPCSPWRLPPALSAQCFCSVI